MVLEDELQRYCRLEDDASPGSRGAKVGEGVEAEEGSMKRR